MPSRTMAETLTDLGDGLLDDFDAITREAHGKYRSYDAGDRPHGDGG